MVSIEMLEGLSFEEAQRLRAAAIETVEGLWSKVGEDRDHGLEQAATEAGMEPDHLADLLAGEAARGTWQPLNVLLLLVPLGLFVLAARVRGDISWPPGMRNNVIVAARDLKAGGAVHPDDVFQGRLTAGPDTFSTTDDVKGLIVGRAIRRGQPIHFEDVLRWEVVALKDIQQGGPLPASALALQIAPFDPEAATSVAQAAGKKVRETIGKDRVVLAGKNGLVSSGPPLTPPKSGAAGGS